MSTLTILLIAGIAVGFTVAIGAYLFDFEILTLTGSVACILCIFAAVFSSIHDGTMEKKRQAVKQAHRTCGPGITIFTDHPDRYTLTFKCGEHRNTYHIDYHN